MFCFKGEVAIEDFVSLINNIYNTVDKLGTPLIRLPFYITELEDRIDVLRDEIDQTEAKKQDALKDYNLTLELLQEYNANKPFILQIRKLKQQLAGKEEEIREVKDELEKERFRNEFNEQFTWRVSGKELNDASIGLGLSPIDNFDKKPSLTAGHLKKLVMDVYYHPSKYLEVIRQIRDIYNSQHKPRTTSIN